MYNQFKNSAGAEQAPRRLQNKFLRFFQTYKYDEIEQKVKSFKNSMIEQSMIDRLS